MIRRWAVAATLGAAVSLVAAGSAPAWQPAEPLTPSGLVGQGGDVEYTSTGDLVVSWVDMPAGVAFAPMRSLVAVKRPGEPLGTPKVIESPASGESVKLATDASGNAIGAWAPSGRARSRSRGAPRAGRSATPKPCPCRPGA